MKKRLLAAMTGVALGAGLVFAFTSPPDLLQGDFVRILYIHVPSAWLAFLAFGVTAAGSIGWLFTRRMGWDRVAEASAETGVLFTAIALATGMLWGKPVWGTYWDWGDTRLATTALMFFVYFGYLALRRTTTDPRLRARRSSGAGRHRCGAGAPGLFLGEALAHPPSGPDYPARRHPNGWGHGHRASGEYGGLYSALCHFGFLPHGTGPHGRGPRRRADSRAEPRHYPPAGRGRSMSVGWVWAAYLATGIILAGYILRLAIRWRRAAGRPD